MLDRARINNLGYWDRIPTIPRAELPAGAKTTVQEFLEPIKGMSERQWEAYAYYGGYSPFSSRSNTENFQGLVAGDRGTALFNDTDNRLTNLFPLRKMHCD
jgi:hypothetical protein